MWISIVVIHRCQLLSQLPLGIHPQREERILPIYESKPPEQLAIDPSVPARKHLLSVKKPPSTRPFFDCEIYARSRQALRST